MELTYVGHDLVDLIQYAVQEGSGCPCSVVDAESILNDWQLTR